MGKIATEQEAYNIGKKGTPITNKCCTKTRAEALGCKVDGDYVSNQLVQKEHLSQAVSYTSYAFLDYKIDMPMKLVWFKTNGQGLMRLIGTTNYPLVIPICYMDSGNKLGFTVSAPNVDDGRGEVIIDSTYHFDGSHAFKMGSIPPYGSPQITLEYSMAGEVFDYGSKENIWCSTKYAGPYSYT